jgi:hypothetical protein
MSAPKPDPIALAKTAWQPTVRWCQKTLKQAHYTDPQVRAAVEQFNIYVQLMLTATNAEQFREAQETVASYVSSHHFLRWAPVPAPMPSV